MSEKNFGEENNFECEDDEMGQYKKCSLNVINFRIVYDENDLESYQKVNCFKPEMAHQVFGESEMIFGYKRLSVNLHYLHNSAKCYVDLQADGKIKESEDCKADDVMQQLNPWLPSNYRVNKKDFLKDISQEDSGVIFGEVIDSFKDAKEKSYKVTLCDITDPQFLEFHQRFETFIIWFIDAANFIDLSDSRWMIFYVYEESQKNDGVIYTPVGFCTVYKFFLYPNFIRPRISQFFVLPTHQRRGVGTKLYCAVYNHLRDLPDSGDITVEEPTEIFQKIRDFCDSLHVYKQLENQKINISTQNQKKISEILKKQKIGKRQSQRIFDILECLKAHKNGYEEYKNFTKNIKSRIQNEIEKETKGSKRLCNMERMGVVAEPIDKQAAVEVEYNRYIDSLEWPTTRLRNTLVKK